MKYIDTGYKSITALVTLSKTAISLLKIEISEATDRIFPESKRILKFITSLDLKSSDIAINMMVDIFYALYKHKPHLKDKEDINPSHIFSWAVVKRIIESPSFKDIKITTSGDELASLIGCEILFESIETFISELKEKSQKFEEAFEKFNQGKGDDEVSDDEIKILMENYDALYNELLKDATSLLSQNANFIPKAAEKIQSTIEGLKDFSIAGEMSGSRTTYSEKLDLIEKLKNNPKLKRVAKMAGKLRDILSTKHKSKRTSKTHSKISGVETGNAINKAMFSELAYLNIPEADTYFMKKYAQKELFQKKHTSDAELGEGPLVVLLDSSGSMSGTRDDFARACCLVLLELAGKQKRAFEIVHFSSGKTAAALTTDVFPRGKVTPKGIVNSISYAEWGGTDFHPPLKRSMNDIDKVPIFLKADIIMITDGASMLTSDFISEFNKWKKQKNVNLFAIGIDTDWKHTDSPLSKIADEGINIIPGEEQDNDAYNNAANLFLKLL